MTYWKLKSAKIGSATYLVSHEYNGGIWPIGIEAEILKMAMLKKYIFTNIMFVVKLLIV